MARVAGRAASLAGVPAARLAASAWPDYSRLFVVNHESGWVIAREGRALAATARRLGIRVAPSAWAAATAHQAVFYPSQFELLQRRSLPTRHRLGAAYFHGRPGTPGMPEFDECWETLRRSHEAIERVQVSHSEMHDVVLSAGIDPAKVFRIPIGVELELFPLRRDEDRRRARAELGLPETAFVVGSFQKDGVGWGDGNEPKAIKGPDVLLDVLARLRTVVPDLYVLLSGPARGFVERGLEPLGIPYRHPRPTRYEDMLRLYAALDVYLCTSRQEGGPKALFEALATGVPFVTTRVGQAMDIVESGVNGWIAEVEDVDGLVESVRQVAEAPAASLAEVVRHGRTVAGENDYLQQTDLWRAFMTGFVELGA